MKIRINGEEAEVLSTTLDGLLNELGYEKGSVATAVNQEFIPQNKREQHTLVDNDSVDIIAPMSGG